MPSAPEGPMPNSYPSIEMAEQLPYYDPELIADKAIWPCVEDLWGGDWHSEAEVGQEMQHPSRGMHDHRLLLVTIRAYSLFYEAGENGGRDTTSSLATLEITEKLTDAERTMAIHRAWRSKPELIESFADEDLVVKRGMEYTFDDLEPAEINAFLVIEDRKAEPVWRSDNEEEIELPEDEDAGEYVIDKFHAEDIENIKVALSILGAFDSCQHALDDIKEQPVQLDE